MRQLFVILLALGIGMPVNAMTQLIILDTPIRKMMIPVISALSRKIFGSSEGLMDL